MRVLTENSRAIKAESAASPSLCGYQTDIEISGSNIETWYFLLARKIQAPVSLISYLKNLWSK